MLGGQTITTKQQTLSFREEYGGRDRFLPPFPSLHLFQTTLHTPNAKSDTLLEKSITRLVLRSSKMSDVIISYQSYSTRCNDTSANTQPVCWCPTAVSSTCTRIWLAVSRLLFVRKPIVPSVIQ